MDTISVCYDELCESLVGERCLHIMRKAYVNVCFTFNYVLKVYPEAEGVNVGEEACFERDWDERQLETKCPLIDVELQGMFYQVLVLPRLIASSNVENAIMRGDLDSHRIEIVARCLVKHVRGISALRLHDFDYIARYRQNIMIQLFGLGDVLPVELLRQVEYLIGSKRFQKLFQDVCGNLIVGSVHGNTFSSNLYLENTRLVILDPISRKHPASISHAISDLAPFISDMRLLADESDWCLAHGSVAESLSEHERVALTCYELLKTLVRIRFGYLESDDSERVNEKLLHNGRRCVVDLINEIDTLLMKR